MDVTTSPSAPAHPPSPPFSSNHTPPGSSPATDSSTTLSATPTPAGGNAARDHAAAPGVDNEGPPSFTFVIALLAIVASALAAILAESQDTVRRWSTGPKVVYGVLVVLCIALLAIGIMAAGRHATVGGTAAMLSVSALCAKLGAIVSSAILVVVVSCKLGRWGCVTGVPPAAMIAALMAAVWAWGDGRAATNFWGKLRGQRAEDQEPAGAYNKV